MQSFYPAQFEREMGCTEVEWLGWLPRAVGVHEHEVDGCSARVRMGCGELLLTWHTQSPRVIALLRLPRLRMHFAFDHVPEPERLAFMKRFDLYTQRGGG